MLNYRLYFLEGGHIRHAVNLDCEDDEHAVETVESHRDGREMELWQGARFVRSFRGDESES